MTAADYVNHPPHYKGRAVECIVATRGMGFSLGNAVKYVYRAWSKGSLMQDLEKAQWYLKDHMKHRECHRQPSSNATDACRRLAAGATGHERTFFYAIADGRYGDAAEAIEQMIADNLEQD